MTEKRSAGPFIERIPEGDNRTRLVCPDCGYIDYANPKIVVGAVCWWKARSCCASGRSRRRSACGPSRPASWSWARPRPKERRARSGKRRRRGWSSRDLVGIYEIPHINQVHIIYRAPMTSPEFAPGLESEAVDLFAWEDIPWDQLAFPSIRWSLERFRAGGGPHVCAATPPKPLARSALR